MVRTPSFDKNGIKKGAWSAEEDRKLEAYITRYGHWNWRELPKFAGLKRCGKSCRLRWMNYLRPNVRRGNYTKQEEDLIMELHEKHGNKWAMIAGRLPGRTDNEIKNYWHTHLKKRWCSSSDNTTTSDSEKSTPRQASSRSTSFSSPNPTPTDEESLSHVNILESSSLSSTHLSSDTAAPATATASISSSTSTGEGIFEDIMSDSFALPETESTSLSDCFISPQSESTSLCDLFQPSTSHTTNCGTSMNMEPPVIESTTQGIYEVLEEDNDFWTKPFNVEDMTSSYNLGGFDHDYSIIENEQLLLSPYMPQYDQSIIDLFFDQDLPML